MRFLQSMLRYLWDAEWFQAYTKRFDFGDGIWRYARLKMLLGAVLGIIGLVTTLVVSPTHGIPRFDFDAQIKSVGEAVISAYPSGLVMQFTHSGLTTNLTGPLLISMKEEWKTESMPYTSLVIIDTVTTGASLTMSGYEDTMVLITHDAIYVHKSESEVRTYFLTSALGQGSADLPIDITRDRVEKFVNSIGAWLQSHKTMLLVLGGFCALLFVAVGFFLVSLVVGIGVACISFLLAIIVWLIGLMIMKRYRYWDAYRHTLLLYTVPWIAGVLGAGRGMRIVLLIAVALWVLYRTYHKPLIAGQHVIDAGSDAVQSDETGAQNLMGIHDISDS